MEFANVVLDITACNLSHFFWIGRRTFFLKFAQTCKKDNTALQFRQQFWLLVGDWYGFPWKTILLNHYMLEHFCRAKSYQQEVKKFQLCLARKNPFFLQAPAPR